MTDKKDSETVKVIAGSLAALTAAWAGSFLGVAGTIAGAGLAAAATAGSNALYQHSLTKAAERARNLRAARFRPKGSGEITVPIRVADLAVRETPRKKSTWKLAALAGGVFAIAVVTLTLIELGVGHPISGGNQGTTLTGFLGGRTTGPKPTHSRVTPAPSTTTAPLLIPSIPDSSVSPSTTTEEPAFTTPDFTRTRVTSTTDSPATTIVPPPSAVEPPEESP